MPEHRPSGPRRVHRQVVELVSGSGAAILTVDFRGGRPGSDFVHLLGCSGMRPPPRLFELVPFGLHDDELHEPTAQSYAAAYAAQVTQALEGPFLVAAFCAGGMTAHVLACLLQEWGVEVAGLLLYDCAPLCEQDVRDSFLRISSGLVHDGSASMATGLDDRLRGATGLLTDRPAEAVDALLELLLPFVRTSAAALGDSEIEAQLVASMRRRYRAWFAYLATAVPRTLPTFRGRAILCRSSEGRDASWPCTAGIEPHVAAVPQAALLTAPEAVSVLAAATSAALSR